MKSKMLIVMGLVVCLVAGVVMAGSPAQTTGTVAVAGTSITCPASGGMAYKLQNVVYDFNAAGGATQTVTVSLVQSGITNQIATKTMTAATDIMLTITNAPWLFQTDQVRITTTGTNACRFLMVGETSH